MDGSPGKDKNHLEQVQLDDLTPEDQDDDRLEFQNHKRMRAQRELAGREVVSSGPPAQSGHEPDADTRTGHTTAITVYILYLVAFFMPVLAAIGFIISLIGCTQFKSSPADHFRFQQKTFLLGALYWVLAYASILILQFLFGKVSMSNSDHDLKAMSALGLVMGVFGFVMSVSIGLWWIYRAVFGLVRLQRRKSI